MTLLEVYLITVLMFYACCAAIYLSSQSVAQYTRNKDLKNACKHLTDKLKKAIVWGGLWPAWLLRLWFKRQQ
jgi:hypothetical protein